MLRQASNCNTLLRYDQAKAVSSFLPFLPTEMVTEIISRMLISSIIRLAITSRKLNKYLLSDDSKMLEKFYWQKQLLAYFPEVAKNVKINYSLHFINHYNQTMKKMRGFCRVNLGGANATIKKDPEIVLTAVKHQGMALKFADDNLKRDREIVLAAVKRHGLALIFVDDNLKCDREIVLAAVKRSGLALEFVDVSLKRDPEVVLTAVKQCGITLQHADDDLKRDPNIALAAVKRNGLALQFAAESFRNDKHLKEIASIADDISRAKAFDEYAQSNSFLNHVQSFLLDNITRKLQQPNLTRANVLDLFKQIKDPEGIYKPIHQQTNREWDTFRLRLFQLGSKDQDTKLFWHTTSFQKAVKLLKEAYIACGNEDKTDQGRQKEADNLIDFTRRNLFGPAKETETRRKFKDWV